MIMIHEHPDKEILKKPLQNLIDIHMSWTYTIYWKLSFDYSGVLVLD